MTLAAYSPDIAKWNHLAAEFLNLPPYDQELYIATVNAGGDPNVLLEGLPNDGIPVVIAASGADISMMMAALSPEAFELTAEKMISYLTGF